jgi:two-component system response regulator MprA
VRALTRRGRGAEERLAYADLVLDLGSRTVTRAGRTLELTGREADLLELLLRESGRVVTRERALVEIWDDGAQENVVDRYVTRLRRKLGEPPLIRTVRGCGFALRA